MLCGIFDGFRVGFSLEQLPWPLGPRTGTTRPVGRGSTPWPTMVDFTEGVPVACENPQFI